MDPDSTELKSKPEEGKPEHEGQEKEYEPPLEMMEVTVNDRLGHKVRVKCSEEDTISEFKMLISAHIGTRPEKIRLQMAHVVYKDHITLGDYEIKDGAGIEMYYN
jgi:ubiquitin-like protein 5